jgi:hypothetical protein
MTLLYRSWWLALALILIACRTPEHPTPPPTTTTIPLAPLPTRTLTPTATITPTAPPTATILPDSEPVLDAALVNDILFRREVAGCVLPCWEGLRIGEAGIDDVQHVMDGTFGLRGSVDVAAATPNVGALWIPDIRGTTTAGHSWTVNNGVSVLRLLFVNQGGSLMGIELATLSVGPYQGYTPQAIIQHMGKPDHVMLHVGPAPNPRGGSDTVFFLVMLYREGFAYSYCRTLPRSEASSPRFCLDAPPTGAAYHIVRPFDDLTGVRADALQSAWVFDDIERRRLRPTEEALGISVSAFAERALSLSPCFEAVSP